MLKNLGDDEDDLEAKRNTKAGSQGRFDATAGEELLDLGGTVGAKLTGKGAGAKRWRQFQHGNTKTKGR